MKKFLIVLLLLAVAGGAFAQLTTNFYFDFSPDLIYVESEHDGANKLNAMTTNVFDDHRFRLEFTWVNENVSAFWQFKFDSLLNRTSTVPALDPTKDVTIAGGSAPSSPGIASGNFNLNTLFNNAIGDFWIKANAGLFGFYLGNTDDRGKVDRFQNFNDYTRTKVDNYGILSPSANMLAALAGHEPPFGPRDYAGLIGGWDINNLKNVAPHGFTGGTGTWGGFFVKPANFTIALAGSTADPGEWVADEYYRKINIGFRASGEKLGDLVTFDFIYKYWNYDPDTWDNENLGHVQPDGQGIATHAFGIYANLLDLVPALGIGVGFSGFKKAIEDYKDTGLDKTFTVKTPLWAGIDLRFQYTGIENVTLTLNNNFSFASIDGSDSDGVIGVYSTTLDITDSDFYLLEGKQSENWKAIYTGLAFAYKVDDTLTLKAQLANKLALGGQEDTTSLLGYKLTATVDNLGFALFAEYVFNPHVMLRGGLDLVNTFVKFRNEPNAPGADVYEIKYAVTQFGIPLYIRVTF